MTVIGSAQAVKILISILRMKVLALLLGPAGIGLLSIYNNLLAMMSTARRPWNGLKRRSADCQRQR